MTATRAPPGRDRPSERPVPATRRELRTTHRRIGTCADSGLINDLHGKHQRTMQPLHDITVLVAEDERPVRMLVRVVLESAGARVLEAEQGAIALRLLDLHPEVDVL